MEKFAPLHIITGYSFLKSGLTIEKVLSCTKNNDYFAAAIADEDVFYGIPSFVHGMKEAKLPYAFGVFYQFENANVVLYAKNEEGYKNLIKINLLKQKGESLDIYSLSEYSKGIIAVFETKYGKINENFNNLEALQFAKYLNQITSIFKDSYLGIEVSEKKDVAFANKMSHFGAEHTYELVAFPRIRYAKKEDAIVLKILEAIENNEHLEIKQQTGQECFFTNEEYAKLYTKKEILNTQIIINQCDINVIEKRGQMMKMSDNDDDLLKNACFSSLTKKGLEKDHYIERLNYELNTIASMGYSSYFLIVEEYVNWAKKQNILVGPGRGSSAGSLVSYLLNITEIDPLHYGLQFERFLNPNRQTMPDIDVDFMDTRRNEVIAHMREKYGTSAVANVITFQTIKSRKAIRDIAAVYQFPERHAVLLIKKLTNPRLTIAQSYHQIAEFKALVDSDEYFKNFISFAHKIEGLPRQAGQHAAAVILNNSSLDEIMPVTIDYDGNYIAQYEAKYLEEQGFLKMDFLSIRNLTMINECVNLINANHQDAHIDAANIPYDEKEIFDLIRANRVSGLFQLDTPLMKKGINILKPVSFNDVVALLALNRPGPMQFIKTYADRRDGKEKFTYLSKDLEDILASTYGIIIYQEQINEIAAKMAGFSLAEADIFRRAISKKEENTLVALKKQFIDGSTAKGYSLEVAENVFNDILKFSNYGFSKLHTVVYAAFCCRQAYLKAHYPSEFFASSFSVEGFNNEEISELKQMGLNLLNPSVNISTNNFEIKDGDIIYPLKEIKGVNQLTCESIINERNKNGLYKNYFDFVVRLFARLHRQYFNEDEFRLELEALVHAGALDEFHNSRATLLANLRNAIQYANLLIGDDDQIHFDNISFLPAPLMNEVEDNPLENIENEFNVLGITLSDNPLNHKKDLIAEKKAISISKIKENNRGITVGFIKNIRNIRTKKNEDMMTFVIYDDKDEIPVVLFPKNYEKYHDYVINKSIVVIEGKVNSEDGEIRLFADRIEPLENEHE